MIFIKVGEMFVTQFTCFHLHSPLQTISAEQKASPLQRKQNYQCDILIRKRSVNSIVGLSQTWPFILQCWYVPLRYFAPVWLDGTACKTLNLYWSHQCTGFDSSSQSVHFLCSLVIGSISHTILNCHTRESYWNPTTFSDLFEVINLRYVGRDSRVDLGHTRTSDLFV